MSSGDITIKPLCFSSITIHGEGRKIASVAVADIEEYVSDGCPFMLENVKPVYQQLYVPQSRANRHIPTLIPFVQIPRLKILCGLISDWRHRMTAAVVIYSLRDNPVSVSISRMNTLHVLSP